MGLTFNTGLLSDAIKISSTLNVGLGTSSPNSILEIKTSTATNSIRLGVIADDNRFNMISLNGLNTEGNYIGFAGGGSTDTNLFYQSGNGGDHRFRTGNGSSFTERMRITNAGNVGIGTTTPDGKLHIFGKTYARYGQDDMFAFYYDDNYRFGITNPSTDLRQLRVFTQAADSVGFIVFATANNTERMRITSGGGVMIGTSSDTGRRLYVLGSTSNSSAWNSTFDNSSGGTIIGFRNDGLISTGGTLSYSPYNLSITPGRALYVDSSGTLGYVSSIRESKININPINSAALINELNPVSFNYRKKDENNQYTEEFSEDLFYGLIADEVEKIDKNLVFYNFKEDGTKELRGVYYEKLTAVLIKAIQEISAKVSALENKA